MKKHLWFTVITAVICFSALSFIACSDDGEDGGGGNGNGNGNGNNYNMTGIYIYTFENSSNTCTWNFYPDGDYSCSGYGITETKTGKWSSNGNDITISYSSSAGSDTVSGSEVFTVQGNGDYITLSLKDNSAQLSNLFVSLFNLATAKSVTLRYILNGLDYEENNSTITITKYLGFGGNVTIPAEINGKPVTIIGENAFSRCNLTSVTIPDSVTSIEYCAFYFCLNLTRVTIGNSVTSIGDNAFNTCIRLANVTIPDSVISIGDGAFYNCSITSVTIGNSVKSIGYFAFGYCQNLTSVTIPNSVTSIGDYAFSDCYNLANVTIPDSVISIGDNVFRFCESLISVTIGNSVKSIGNSAFCDCKSLLSITIPNSVKSIGDNVFQDCTSLTSVTFLGSIPLNNNSFSDGFSFIQGGDVNPYVNNLLIAFYATDSTNGTPGMYTRPNTVSSTWKRQN